ncbi:MAG TPA: serpin family protein, partial [Ardenticatenaceae bacterium]|nr:serpin family protein [Ardenticatenaceae bacterium]
MLVMVLIGALVLGCAAPATSLPTLSPEPTSQQPSAEPEPPGGDNPSPTAEVAPSDATTQEPDVEATQPAEPTEAASTREPAAQPTAGVETITERDLSPDAPEEDVAELATGNSQFAFELYQNLKQEKGNLFFSPFSISLALAMTYAGARGETEAQMAETLRFTLPQARLHPAFNALDLELASRGQEHVGEADPFTLNIANALWGQAGYDFLPEFLELVGVNYGAGMRLLDFAMAPEESRTTINDWVSEATEGKIENLIPEGVLGPGTRLVLTNAIYFFAAWLNPFPESATRDGSFTLLNGDEVSVPMMVQEAGFAYAAGDGYQAIELPYVGSEVSMIVLVPDTGQFEAFEESLD